MTNNTTRPQPIDNSATQTGAIRALSDVSATTSGECHVRR